MLPLLPQPQQQALAQKGCCVAVSTLLQLAVPGGMEGRREHIDEGGGVGGGYVSRCV